MDRLDGHVVSARVSCASQIPDGLNLIPRCKRFAAALAFTNVVCVVSILCRGVGQPYSLAILADFLLF